MDSETIANALGNQWNYTTRPAKRFIKLDERLLGEIVINVSAITFINIQTREIYVCNTDVEGNGILRITDYSMKKLLSIILY